MSKAKPLKVWRPKEPEPPKERQYYLDLRKDGRGRIDVILVDDLGKFVCYMIGLDCVTAAVERYPSVDEGRGFELDVLGRVTDMTPNS